MKRVRKAVLPVGGYGTRFLPVTKAIPKEMLPIIDIPAIQLIVEECVASGIEEVIFVTGRGKEAILDHFDRAPELERLLESKNRTAEATLVRGLSEMARFTAVRQGDALGLGHAVLTARAAVGNEPFAVLLGDDLVESNPPGLAQLLDVFERRGTGVVGLQEVPSGQEHLYGVVAGERLAPREWRVDRMVEKPAPGTAPSRLAIIGRYVLPPEIFDALSTTKPGRGGEIQLTDALAVLASRHGVHGIEMAGHRYDVGDRAGYVLAVLHHALRRADLADQVRAGAQRILAELSPDDAPSQASSAVT